MENLQCSFRKILGKTRKSAEKDLGIKLMGPKIEHENDSEENLGGDYCVVCEKWKCSLWWKVENLREKKSWEEKKIKKKKICIQKLYLSQDFLRTISSKLLEHVNKFVWIFQKNSQDFPKFLI